LSASYNSVLLIERELPIKRLLEGALLREGLQTIWARSSADAERVLARQQPSLILFDPRLGPEDGWSVLRRLRRGSCPLLVLISETDPVAERLALALGAEGCVSIAAGPDQVALQSRFVLRRAPGAQAEPVSFGRIALDPGLGGARLDGRPVPLTPSEYHLLAALIEARGGVVSREQLVLQSRGQARSGLPLVRAVDAGIRSLRRKLGDDPREPKLLQSIRGFGYRLSPSDGNDAPGIAEAALDALPEPILVLDERRRIKLMNRAAESLAGVTAASVVDRVSCATLLQCRIDDTSCPSCPWFAARVAGAPREVKLLVHPRGESVAVTGVATALRDGSGRKLLRLGLQADA
jgi:DNA-binding response OmpR family regulator